MEDAFDALSVETLRALADAFESGRLVPPYPLLSIRSVVGVALASKVHAALVTVHGRGLSPAAIAWALRLLARERTATRHARDDIELVWTGPEVALSTDRDTVLVVRELFEAATQSVMIAGYKIYRVPEVFGPLATRMGAMPSLSVRMFLHVDPAPEGGEAEALRTFAEQFRRNWPPGHRLPEVFYYPATTRRNNSGRPEAALHAKCVVVDSEQMFITSANFSEAAQTRNIEVGVRLRDAVRAQLLRKHFEDLVTRGVLLKVPTLG